MKKMYRVVIHYEGAVAFEVEADNEEKAELLAERYFDNMDDRELVANLADINVCDCYEIDEEA